MKKLNECDVKSKQKSLRSFEYKKGFKKAESHALFRLLCYNCIKLRLSVDIYNML